MKSPYKIAKELEVSPQSVYQKIERMQEQLNPHIQRDGKKILIDEKGETLLKSTFLNMVEQAVEQDLFKQLNKQLNMENEYLRKQNELLLQELSREREQNQITIEKEREHSRQQAQSLAELSEKLAELTKNGQILLLKQEQMLLVSNEQPQDKKKSLWQKLFKGKKNKR